jgi:hypothetical protein
MRQLRWVVGNIKETFDVWFVLAPQAARGDEFGSSNEIAALFDTCLTAKFQGEILNAFPVTTSALSGASKRSMLCWILL